MHLRESTPVEWQCLETGFTRQRYTDLKFKSIFFLFLLHPLIKGKLKESEERPLVSVDLPSSQSSFL